MGPFLGDQRPQRYDLCAIVIHHGAGTTSGHYTAMGYHTERQEWLHFNDKRVDLVSEAEVANSQPYLLMYVHHNLFRAKRAGQPTASPPGLPRPPPWLSDPARAPISRPHGVPPLPPPQSPLPHANPGGAVDASPLSLVVATTRSSAAPSLPPLPPQAAATAPARLSRRQASPTIIPHHQHPLTPAKKRATNKPAPAKAPPRAAPSTKQPTEGAQADPTPPPPPPTTLATGPASAPDDSVSPAVLTDSIAHALPARPPAAAPPASMPSGGSSGGYLVLTPIRFTPLVAPTPASSSPPPVPPTPGDVDGGSPRGPSTPPPPPPPRDEPARPPSGGRGGGTPPQPHPALVPLVSPTADLLMPPPISPLRAAAFSTPGFEPPGDPADITPGSQRQPSTDSPARSRRPQPHLF
ncbi:hypothetical protein PAPYR_4998 [Paratrimastix pyriformis]|uniref:ubiquitinyl hydrolase 1 n=1 Tax=Paratrimastix pyriformis TaxID=342808 RepID=A0ABQ8UJ04_9EUKA|nr:hypothetical protein PAPYR_4998 [Paratrimastix pyriformis]